MAAHENDARLMGARVVRSVSTTRAAVGVSAAAIGAVVLAVVPGKAQIVGVVFAVAFLLTAWRAWVAGIHVEADGVRVVGILGSRRFAWEKIDHFAVGPFAGYQYVGHVVLRDGRDIGCLAIAAATRPHGERHRLEVQRPIDQLNAILAAWRSSSGQLAEL